MRLYRFVVGPEKVRVPYDPVETFRDRLVLPLTRFREEHGQEPNRCYVGMSFPDSLPAPMGQVSFRRQTLLAENEVLIGVEIETQLGGGDHEWFIERAVG